MAPPHADPILSQMEDTLVPVSHSKSSGGCYILPRAPRMTPIMPPEHSLSLTRIMAPPQAISILCQVSWQVPYLGCRSDFNNGLKGDSNSGPILASFVWLKQWPFPRSSQSCVRSSYMCSCFLLMASWQGPYLVKGCKPDFNNGFRGDSNSGPQRLFESDSNNGHFPGHSNTKLQSWISPKLF